jgi:superfamily II DNA or RNA helicase
VRVKIIIKNRIIIKYKELRAKDPYCFQEIKSKFTYRNPTYDSNNKHGYSVANIPEFIKSVSFNNKKGRMYIHRGCLKDVRKILKKYNHTVKIVDKTVFDESKDVKFSSNIVLRPEQKDAFDDVVNSRFGGLVKASTSFGKTVLGLAIVVHFGKVANVFVWSKKHQSQWYKEILKFNICKDSEIGGIGGIFNKPKVGKINLIMQQSVADTLSRSGSDNLAAYIDHPINIIDEGQRWSAETFIGVVTKLRGKYIVGVSADFRRRDKKEFIIYNTIGTYIHVAKEKASGSKILANIYLVRSRFYYRDYMFDRNRVELLKEMGSDKKRNLLICQRALRKVRKGKLVIIMVEHKDHAVRLYSMLKNKSRCRMMIGTTPKKTIENYNITSKQKQLLREYKPDAEYETILKEAKTKDIDIIIGTSITFVGLSIKTIDHAVIATPSSRDLKLFNQKVGRVERSYGDDKELLELFGKKETPTVDYIADMAMGPLCAVANIIKEEYPRKVKFINPYKIGGRKKK